MPDPDPFSGEANPLESEDPAVWNRLIEAVGPASLLVVIESRLGSRLRRAVSAEDVWQETLLHAWRDRLRCDWRGVGAFRRWLIRVAENRLRDLAQAEGALKRGGDHVIVPLPGAVDSATSSWAGPIARSTPSKAVMAAEQAAAMTEALDVLDEDVRDVVRLRLFEDLTMEEVAERVGIGLQAARHRFRKGAGVYHQRLAHVLETRRIVTPRHPSG